MDASGVYEGIALRTREAVRNSVVVVSIYDTATDCAEIKAVHGLGTLMQTVHDFLGRSLKGWRGRLTTRARDDLTSGTLHYIEGGVHEAFFRRVPAGLAQWVERLCGITAIYARGLLSDEGLEGSVVIVLRGAERFACPPDLDGFYQQAAGQMAECRRAQE